MSAATKWALLVNIALSMHLEAIPDCVGTTEGQFFKWATLIETSDGEPNIWYATVAHWAPAIGEVVTFGDGQSATVAGWVKIRQGPVRQADGSWGGEADVLIGWLDAPVTTPPAKVWWGWPPGMRELQTLNFTGVSVEEDGLLYDYEAEGFFKWTGIEWTTGVWYCCPSNNVEISPGDSGAPLFLGGRYVGATGGQTSEGGVVNPLCWVLEDFPANWPTFAREAPPVVSRISGNSAKVCWRLPDTGWHLEVTSAIPGPWEDQVGTAKQEGNFATITLPFTLSNRFWRLTKNDL